MYGRQLLGVKRRRPNGIRRAGRARTTTTFTPRPSASNAKSQIQRSKVASARFLATLSSRGLAGELKFFDTFVLSAACYYEPVGSAIISAQHGSRSVPSTCYALNAMDAGTADNQRIGKQVNLRSVFIRGDVYQPKLVSISDPRPTAVRVIMFMDTQNNGQTPSASSVIPYITDTGAGNYNALRNLDYTSRFRVLMDEKIILVPPVQAVYSTGSSSIVLSQYEVMQPFEKYVNLKGMKTNYSGTTATSANIVDNAIYVMAFANTPEDNFVAANYVYMNFSARVRFSE